MVTDVAASSSPLALQIGYTPLHCAAEDGHADVAQLLVDALASLETTSNVRGAGALLAATRVSRPRWHFYKHDSCQTVSATVRLRHGTRDRTFTTRRKHRNPRTHVPCRRVERRC